MTTATGVRVDADLGFELLDGAARVQGRLAGSGASLRLELTSAAQLLSRFGDDDGDDLAGLLARHGIVVEIVADGAHVLSLGAVRRRLLDVLVLRRPHTRLGRLLPAARLGRRIRRERAAGAPSLVPPGTPAPLLPWRDRRVRTTHDPARAGHPRLYVHRERSYAGASARELALGPEGATIGSAPDCTHVFPGLAATHVVVSHTSRDEYVAVNTGPPGSMRANGATVQYALLRTGVGLEVGGLRLNYVRDEHADHGRPYGGRAGGEIGRQRTQPPRPS